MKNKKIRTEESLENFVQIQQSTILFQNKNIKKSYTSTIQEKQKKKCVKK